jgi:pimeloyl-ACP methyl ester carboxylesterase
MLSKWKNWLVEEGGVDAITSNSQHRYEIGFHILRSRKSLLQHSDNIVFLNGSLFNLHQWDKFFQFGIKPSFRNKSINLIRYDYAATGRSFHKQPKWDLFAMVEELKLLLDRLLIDKTHLYGISKGTGVAQLFAATYPDRVMSLAGYGWLHFAYSDIKKVANFFADRLKAFSFLEMREYHSLTKEELSEVYSFAKQYFNSLSPVNIPHFLQVLLEGVAKNLAYRWSYPTSLRTMYDWFKYAVEMMPDAGVIFGRERYHQLERVPLLIQHGRGDKTLPFEMAKELNQLITTSQFIGYPKEYGHISIMINPIHAYKVAKDYYNFVASLK